MKPYLLDLADKDVLVVGAGAVASRRVTDLLEASARVTVVAPEATDLIHHLASSGQLTHHVREFRESDIAQSWMVISATGTIDDAVAKAAHAARVWCVNAAAAEKGTARTMTPVAGPDGILIAVFGGDDPRRTQRLRAAISEQLSNGRLPVAAQRTRSGPGRVALVGAGPGDPELVTVRGARVIAEADVLVIDRLAPRELWQHRTDALVIDVGKAPGRHAADQSQINQLIVEHALAGKRVVRVKGGDPFVLGRGGEEALACIEAGVEVEVVPGVTSAISVAAAAGIPVTHRGISHGFAVLSAHEGAEDVCQAAVALPATTTLVLLMGARHLHDIAESLILAGRDKETGLAVLESGWTHNARTTTGTLLDGATGAITATAPAVVVIGDVVGMREQLGDLAVTTTTAAHRLDV